MIELKSYQRRCIEELTAYLRGVREANDPNTVFYKRTGKPYTALHSDPKSLFVCTRVPTGGGKTLIAAHSVAVAFRHYLIEREETGLVLWLVPSDTIRTQTLGQLRDRNHPYREVLDHAFEGRIKILDIVEARNIKPADISDNICIVVSTLAAVRRENTEGLKVYQQNGALMEHFRDVDDDNLLKTKEETVIQSLANVIRLHHPLIILDEGHNAQTELSVEVIDSFLPSCILEYTATPLENSNVLIEIPAVELKREEMVKIPIHLTNITQWQEAVREAKTKRDELETEAKKEERKSREFIRPILLLQAEMEQEREDRIHVHRLVDFLTGELKVKRDEIAIKTGKEDELKEHALFDSLCPIRYIVTCAALKEGWDCSFAYVLASVSNLGTRLGVEQLIGRILRLPNAKRKTIEALNHSYVYTSSRRFDDAAQLVVKGLQQEGYDQSDIIRSDEKRKKADYESVRVISDDEIELPYLAIKGQKLDFYDLIPEDFSIGEKGGLPELLSNIENRTSLIDVEEDAVVTSAKQKIRLLQLSAEETKNELVRWFSRNVQENAIDKTDMTKFLKSTVSKLQKKYSLILLFAQKFSLRDALNAYVRQTLNDAAEKTFMELSKNNQLSASNEQWLIPHTMTLLHPLGEQWKKHLFDRCDDLNPEELEFARRLDEHHDVMWWHRNIVHYKDGFRLQGFRSEGFFPDFIVQTKRGRLWIMEYKGADRVSNEDTAYKEHLGQMWAAVCGKKYAFRIVTVKNMIEVLSELSTTQ